MDLGALIQSGWAGYVIIIVAGVLMTEPWRWAGVRLSRNLDVDSEIFRWVRAVSTALVAGLVARMVMFPTGQLESVQLDIRLIAFASGLFIYLFAGRILAAGVFGAAAVLLAGTYLTAG